MPRSFLMRKNSAEELKELMKNSAPDKNEHEHETERHEDLIVDVESVEENEEHQFVEPPYIIRNEFLSDHLYSIQSYKRPIMSAPPPLTKAPPVHVRSQRPKEPPVLTMQSQDECWKTKIDTLLAAAQLMKLRESVVLKEKMWPNNKYNDLPSPSESEASSTTSLEEGGGFPKYQCHQCHKVFKTKYTLTIHMRMPDHTKTRPFVCNICGKGFRLSSTLCRHKIIHTTEKPHKCQHCHKAFNRSSTLKTHMKTHSQQKDFVCDICDKGFHQKGNLRNHRLVHTGERPFQCTECDKSFCKLSNLKLHMQSHETGGSE